MSLSFSAPNAALSVQPQGKGSSWMFIFIHRRENRTLVLRTIAKTQQIIINKTRNETQ